MAGLLDFFQGASNAAASNVSGPVDAISWLLRKGGLGGVIGPAPVGSSEWLRQKGLTRPAEGVPGLLGEAAGLAAPLAIAAMSPQIASGLLRVADNAAAPTSALNMQRGAVNLGADDAAMRLRALEDKWDKAGVTLSASYSSSRPELLTLSKIQVPKASRGQGIGSSAMDDLLSYADETGKVVALSPSTDFGATSVARLKDFYKRFGFVENKGKFKDFTISESMYRPPK